MDLSRRKGNSPSRVYSQQRVGMNAEGRFIAHWDEFVEHRKEVQLKFEEAFEMVQERRDAELRYARLCQHLEARVQRLAQQSGDAASRAEAAEARMALHSRDVDGCREGLEALRDKVQRNVQDLVGALSSLRAEVGEDLEQRHQAIFEALRRGDRSMAEELLKTLTEADGRSGAAVAQLQEQLAQHAAQAAELRLALERVEQATAQHGEGLAHLREEQRQTSACVPQLEAGQDDHRSRLVGLEARIAEMQERLSCLEARSDAAGQQAGEAAARTAADVQRIQHRFESELRSAVADVREHLRGELRALRETLGADLRAGQEVVSAELTACREVASSADEARHSAERLRLEAADACAQVRRGAEELVRRLRHDLDANFQELRDQLLALQDQGREVRSTAIAATDQVSLLSEGVRSVRVRLGELSTFTSQVQVAAEEASADSVRLRSHTESGLMDLRREVAQVAALAHQLQEAREETRDQLSNVRAEGRDRSSAMQKQSKELTFRLERAEQALEEHSKNNRDELHDLSRRCSEGLARTEERLQTVVQQSDANLISLRRELAKVSATAQDLRLDVEQACRRLLSDEARVQGAALSEALLVQQQGFGDALANAVAEPRAEVKALRLALTEHEAATFAREERLAGEVERQSRAHNSQLKGELGEFTATVEERLASVANAARQLAQEQRHETQQQVARQLRPLSEKLAEVAGDVKAAKRAEAEIASHYEHLQRTYADLTASQELLSQRATAAVRDLATLKAELRAEARVDALRLEVAGCREGDRSRQPWKSCLDFAPVSSLSPPRLGARLGARTDDAFEAHAAAPLLHDAVETEASRTLSRLGELRRRLGSPRSPIIPTLRPRAPLGSALFHSGLPARTSSCSPRSPERSLSARSPARSTTPWQLRRGEVDHSSTF